MSEASGTRRMQNAEDFWTELFRQAEIDDMNIPHHDRNPYPKEILDTPAVREIVYRLRVTKENARIVLTNKPAGSRLAAYDYLSEHRSQIDQQFLQGNGTPHPLEWCDNRTGGLDHSRSKRWWIRYVVNIGSGDRERWPAGMTSLNRASVVLRNVFQPYLNRLSE